MPLDTSKNTVYYSGITEYGAYTHRVVQAGLVCHLDGDDENCYSGAGTTLTDLSREGNDGTMHGTTSVSGGYIDLGSGADITNYITVPAGVLDGLTEWTMEFWLNKTTHNDIDTFQSAGTGNDILLYFNGSTATLVTFSNVTSTNISFTSPTGTDYQFVLTGQNNGFGTLYKNGTRVADYNNRTLVNVQYTGGIVLGQEVDNNSTGGFQSIQKFRGKYGIIRYYNRALHSYEVAENFQANRGRYGL